MAVRLASDSSRFSFGQLLVAANGALAWTDSDTNPPLTRVRAFDASGARRIDTGQAAEFGPLELQGQGLWSHRGPRGLSV